jgi:hypothetical protein
MGYQPETLFRPRLLEDPKLFLIYILLGFAITITLGSFVLNRLTPPEGGRSPAHRKSAAPEPFRGRAGGEAVNL